MAECVTHVASDFQEDDRHQEEGEWTISAYLGVYVHEFKSS